MPRMRQIRASAGSGKTYDLTSRFIRLLANSCDREDLSCSLSKGDGLYSWKEILAVTFTNLAAEEMRDRVIRRLKESALGLHQNNADMPLIGAEASQWLTILIRNFSSLQIRTIDSLLDQIVRMSALELHLSPDFTPSFENEESAIPILEQFLSMSRNIEDGNKYRTILKDICQNIIFYDYNFKGFTGKDKIRKDIIRLVFCILLSQNNGIQLSSSQELDKRLQELVNNVENTAKILEECILAQELDVKKDMLTAIEKCKHLSNNVDVIKSTYLEKSSIDECLNKSSKGKANSKTQSAYLSLVSANKAFADEGKLIRNGQRFAPLVMLADLLASAFTNSLSDEGVVPQSMIASYAQEALQGQYGVSATLCKMGTHITHILIDEFQDTSHGQWDAMQKLVYESLSSGGSFTWVGDVKQAIYGWRQGDARLFDSISEDKELLSVSSLKKDILPFNRRSYDSIVEHNNNVFGRLCDIKIARLVMDSMLSSCSKERREAEAEALVKNFSDSEQKIELGMRAKPGGYVRLSVIKGENKDDTNEAVHKNLIALVHELQERNRPFGDIAILVRSNEKATLVAQWLAESGIAVVTDNSFLLADQPLIRELIALLGFINVPEDDVSFLGVITGTYLFRQNTDISFEKLHNWISSRKRDKKMPLWMRFRVDFPDDWNDFFVPLYHKSGLIGAYDIIFEVLNKYHIWELFPNDIPFAQRFLEILYLAEENGASCISDFLEYWKKHGKEEKAPMPESLNAIRVMTIHKSKGCEFPVVIVPWHDLSVDVSYHEPVIAKTSSGLCILANPCKEMKEEYEDIIASLAQEALHVLYVAWTRPKEELYGFLTFQENKKISNSENTFNALIGDIMQNKIYESGNPRIFSNVSDSNNSIFLTYNKEDTCVNKVFSDTKEVSQKIYDTCIISNDEPMYPDPFDILDNQEPIKTLDNQSINTVYSHIENMDKNTINDEWRPMDWLPQLKIFRNPLGDMRDIAAVRGTFIHRCLEYLVLSENRKKDAHNAVIRGIDNFPLKIEFNLDEIEAILEWYAGLPDTPHWMQFGVPEQSMVDENGKLRRVDLLVNDGKSITVVDYKTGEKHFSHKEQVSQYMKMLKATQNLPIRGILVYLDLKECISV